MFNRVLREIEICLANDAPLAALSLALSLPDAFGKIEYKSDGSKDRYVKWINKYAPNIIYGLGEITTPIRDENGKLRKVTTPSDGDMVYHVRSTLFHESTTKLASKGVVNYVRLKDDEPNKSRLYAHAIGSTVYDEKEDSLIIHYRISIRGLVEGITDAARKYYDDNIDKMSDYENDWTISVLRLPF